MPPSLDPFSAIEADPTLLIDQTDLRQRQRAVILAYSRRTVARGEPIRLMLDAASLIGETLHVPLRGTIGGRAGTDAWQLQIRIPGAETLEHAYPADARNSLAAFALAEGRPVVCSNLATETRFKDQFLRQGNIASALVLPLKIENRVFGAVGVFDRIPREFHVDDIEFADTIAHLLLSTIARLDLTQALAAERQTLAAVLDTSESLVLVTDLAGCVIRTNKAAERVSGYSLDELSRRSLWDALAVPGELRELKQHFSRRPEPGQSVNYEGSLQPKQGELRRIRWSQTTMLDASGAAASIVLTGVDISELANLERQLRDARRERGSAGPKSDAVAAAAFQVVDDSPQAKLRSSPRRAYPYRQSVAPFIDGKLPTKADFKTVQFRDISAGGVSFIINERPTFDFLVLQLGCDGNVHYMSAKVVNATEIKSADGTTFLVGCRFMERVHLQ